MNRWYLYQKVTENILRTCEENQVFLKKKIKFAPAVDLNNAETDQITDFIPNMRIKSIASTMYLKSEEYLLSINFAFLFYLVLGE